MYNIYITQTNFQTQKFLQTAKKTSEENAFEIVSAEFEHILGAKYRRAKRFNNRGLNEVIPSESEHSDNLTRFSTTY